MSLPEWVRVTKAAEDSATRKQTTYRRFTGLFTIVFALALLWLGNYQQSNTVGIEGVSLALLAVLLSTSLLQNYIVPSPAIPTYERLAAAIYCVGEDLTVETREGKEDRAKQLERIHTLVTKQKPEFEKKDLVFGVALSVLGKLDEVKKRLEVGSESGIPKESLSPIQSSLKALGNTIVQSKNVNSGDIEVIVDGLVANLSVITLPASRRLLSQSPAWLDRLSNKQTYVVEVIIALFGGVLVTFLFKADVPEGLAVFFSMAAFLFETERKFRKKP